MTSPLFDYHIKDQWDAIFTHAMKIADGTFISPQDGKIYDLLNHNRYLFLYNRLFNNV